MQGFMFQAHLGKRGDSFPSEVHITSHNGDQMDLSSFD